MKKFLSLMVMAFFATNVMRAEVCESDTVCAEGAWCWFADPRALHYENADGSINATYIGYIDVRHHLARRGEIYRDQPQHHIPVALYPQRRPATYLSVLARHQLASHHCPSHDARQERPCDGGLRSTADSAEHRGETLRQVS